MLQTKILFFHISSSDIMVDNRKWLSTHSALIYLQLVIISFGENTLGDGSPEDWARIKEWALDIANNGQKEGESCEFRPSDAAALEIARLAKGDLTEMAKYYPVADFEKVLSPDRKYVVCAAKLNLICSEIHNQCKSCASPDISGSAVELCGQRVKDIVEKLV